MNAGVNYEANASNAQQYKFAGPGGFYECLPEPDAAIYAHYNQSSLRGAFHCLSMFPTKWCGTG